MRAMAQTKRAKQKRVRIADLVRQALGLKPGDKLLVVTKGDELIVMPRPSSFAAAIRGIGRGLYPKGYLRKERSSWRKQRQR